MKTIISDSSTLIALLDSKNLELLFKLFDKVILSKEVYNEVCSKIDYKEILNLHIKLDNLSTKEAEHKEMYEMLRKRLYRGESESIVLAKKLSLPLIIDEKKGRQIAKSLDIKVIGLVGIILKLLEKGIMTPKRAKEIVAKLEENNFRLSNELKVLIYNF